MAMKRKYPVGIQSFENIRMDGYIYVDKTPLIYKMITEGKPYFLSRPRRFGKSLLVDTLAKVFEGRRELFEAFTTEDGIEQPQLFIAQTDWRWEKHPVIRFDFSSATLVTVDDLDELINFTLADYEQQYGVVNEAPVNYGLRMTKIIQAAERKTGHKVVVLVDEYDNFSLHSLGEPEKQRLARERFQSLFEPLKSQDEHLKFVFITGISKFSQMGIFSRLNQLNNISMQQQYEAICGITEEELTTTLRPDIELMARQQGLDYDDMLAMLKHNYDGYHFGTGKADIYNPFSLFNALKSGELASYWFESGTTRALIDMLSQMPRIELADVENVRCPATAFDLPFDSYEQPLPVLYQSGYLTIKRFLADRNMYVLGTPNQEVRQGLAGCLLQVVASVKAGSSSSNAMLDAYYDFRDSGDLNAFIEALKSFFASVPYHMEQGNQNEHYYHALLYTLLASCGADVTCEDSSAKGRADLTLKMPKGIYIMELKYDKSADEAIKQIDERGYAKKYALDGRPVTKVGISFSKEERNITDWKAE